MSDLTSIEKIQLEKLFGMGDGYVLDFSNRAFQEFIIENTGINIYDKKYEYKSGSKANRLRAFWKKESNYLVGKLISCLLDYFFVVYGNSTPEREKILHTDCRRIAERLKTDNSADIINRIQSFSDSSDSREFFLLIESIKDSLSKNEPEIALDRLHTLVFNYLKIACAEQFIRYKKGNPLHSVLGEYIKFLKKGNFIESEMTERIIKSSISVLEAFNDVRNNQSLAHDNPILNKDESAFICNCIIEFLIFIHSIREKVINVMALMEEEDDLPF